MIYCLLYFVINIATCEEQRSSFFPLSSLNVINFYHTLGLKSQIFLFKTKQNKINAYQCSFVQKDMHDNIVTKIKWRVPNLENKSFFTLKKNQKTGDLNVNVNVLYKSNMQVVVENKNNFKDILLHKYYSCNLYGFLNFIKDLDINLNYIPDYLGLSIDKPPVSEAQQFYTFYYKMHGINKKSTPQVYIYDTKTITMGNIIGTLGNPVQILMSGNGEETFIYVGLHICKKLEKENQPVLFSFMAIQFDTYGKMIKIFYHIPFCKLCHKNVHMKTIYCQSAN